MRRVLFPLLLLVMVLGVWGSVFFSDYLIGRPLPGSLNQFGDAFGAVNALFAGLGFAGIVYSLYLQRSEIDKAAGQIDTQRQAIEELTKSLARQSDLLNRSADAQRSQAEQMSRLVSVYEEHLKPAIALANSAEAACRDERLRDLMLTFKQHQPAARKRIEDYKPEKDDASDIARRFLGEEYFLSLQNLLEHIYQDDDIGAKRDLQVALSDAEKKAILHAFFQNFVQQHVSKASAAIAQMGLCGLVSAERDGLRSKNYMNVVDQVKSRSA